MYDSNKNFYKIPVGFSFKYSRRNDGPLVKNFNKVHICINTGYTTLQIPHKSTNKFGLRILDDKFKIYKPVYFERFKYVGKGFKLIFKKKKKMFNCIFGHSHIYWVKLQNAIVKKTKKYRYMFVAKNLRIYNDMINILKKIKPINRYTLRGVRTYTHAWVKRKGRKSVATHV